MTTTPQGKMMFDPKFDFDRRRLHIRYSGFWTVGEARDVVERFRAALREAAASGRAFTLLDDLRKWPAQSREVVDITKQLPEIVREMPVTRNAMIIEQALLRLQVNRALEGLANCAVFKTYEEADQWLSEVEPSPRL